MIIYMVQLKFKWRTDSRILIARALYKQPKILIIDEGFNQLDNETEKQILNSILEIKDLIVIFVYHNFLKKIF